MANPFIIELAGLAVFGAVLFLLVGRRFSRETKVRLQRQKQEFPPTAFDPSPITPRIERLRAGLNRENCCGSYRPVHARGLLKAARTTIERLSYFRQLRSTPEFRLEDPAQHRNA
jgi:hypothetical protein